MAREHGFDEESLRDGVLLLLGEVGEMARAVREEGGLKFSAGRLAKPKFISDELADCMIYLFPIANLAHVDSERVLRQK